MTRETASLEFDRLSAADFFSKIAALTPEEAEAFQAAVRRHAEFEAKAAKGTMSSGDTAQMRHNIERLKAYRQKKKNDNFKIPDWMRNQSGAPPGSSPPPRSGGSPPGGRPSSGSRPNPGRSGSSPFEDGWEEKWKQRQEDFNRKWEEEREKSRNQREQEYARGQERDRAHEEYHRRRSEAEGAGPFNPPSSGLDASGRGHALAALGGLGYMAFAPQTKDPNEAPSELKGRIGAHMQTTVPLGIGGHLLGRVIKDGWGHNYAPAIGALGGAALGALGGEAMYRMAAPFEAEGKAEDASAIPAAARSLRRDAKRTGASLGRSELVFSGLRHLPYAFIGGTKDLPQLAASATSHALGKGLYNEYINAHAMQHFNKNEAKKSEKTAFSTNAFSGPMNPNIQSGASIIPPFKQPSLRAPVEKTAKRYKLEGDAVIEVGADGKSLGKGPIKLGAASWQRALRSGAVSAEEFGNTLGKNLTPGVRAGFHTPMVEGAAQGLKEPVQNVRSTLMTPGKSDYSMPQVLRGVSLKKKMFDAQAAQPHMVGNIPKSVDVSVRGIPLGSETGATMPLNQAKDWGTSAQQAAWKPSFGVQAAAGDLPGLHHELAEVHAVTRGGGTPFATHVNERPAVAQALGSWSTNRISNKGSALAKGMSDGDQVTGMMRRAGATPWNPIPLDGKQHAAVRRMTEQGVASGQLEDNKGLKSSLQRTNWRTPSMQAIPPAAPNVAKVAASAPTRGNFMMASDVPPLKVPSLRSPIEKNSDMMDTYYPYGPGDFKPARLTGKTAGLSPMQSAVHAKSIGAPRLSAPPGPSIADIAKPKGPGMGSGIAGAFKGSIGGTAGVSEK